MATVCQIETFRNYWLKLRMVLETKHITEHRPHKTLKNSLKSHSVCMKKRTRFVQRYNEIVVYRWCTSCASGKIWVWSLFQLAHGTLNSFRFQWVPSRLKSRKYNRNLYVGNTVGSSTYANILRQAILWIMCKSIKKWEFLFTNCCFCYWMLRCLTKIKYEWNKHKSTNQ